MVDDMVITGEQRLQMFKELKEDRTILQMSPAGADISKLTLITGIGEKQKTPHFTVNCPEEFARAVQADMERLLLFSFTDKQGVPYAFTTSAASILDGKSLLLAFPDEIRKTQRRRHVRIKLDSHACLTAWAADIKYAMSISDISEGGALVIIKEGSDPPRQLLTQDDKLMDLQIELAPGKPNNVEVTVNQAEVRRVAIGATSGRFQYGIMFTDADDGEIQRLKRAIESNYPQKLRRKVKAD